MKAGILKTAPQLLALPQLKNQDMLKYNHHVKPFLKNLILMQGISAPPIRQKANYTNWCYPDQTFDCIMTLIIRVHLCSKFLKLLKVKLHGKFFLIASLLGHMIRFFHKTDKGFIHFKKIFDTFASLRLNQIANT